MQAKSYSTKREARRTCRPSEDMKFAIAILSNFRLKVGRCCWKATFSMIQN